MKNLKYFPYERNRYFYGKLLGVDDFEAEQKYMNDKRRLINRFMHGCGVVCGLNVVPVGEDSVCVEAGIALDFAGREIVVDEPVTRKLSEIEGFSACTDDPAGENSYLYLCIEYAEYEKQQVYSVAGSGVGGQTQYNRIAEGYHMYLTAVEPEQCAGGSSAYYEERKTLYWGNGVRISQVFPRYAKSGSEFEARIVVENMGQKHPVAFHYELALDCLKKDQKQWVRIEFDEEKYERARRYEIPVTFEAGNVQGVPGWAKLKEGSFALRIGGCPVEAQASAENMVELIGGSVGDAAGRRYFAQAMREVKSGIYHQSIYLAKILLFAAGSAVVIDDIEEMPFGQYICSDVLSGIRERAAAQEQKYMPDRGGTDRSRPDEDHGKESSQSHISSVSGTTVIDLGIGGITGQRFFSQPVVHGLGPGDISVSCKIAGNASKPSEIYCGDPEVFGEEERDVTAKTAVKADTVNGTFVIGIMLTRPTTANKVKIYWTAICDRAEDYGEKAERTLFLKPDMIYLKLREDYFFEPVFTGAGDKRVVWSVTEQGGGTIDENGMYTAPSVPGIYEIMARSASDPKLFATAYVVVRDVRTD